MLYTVELMIDSKLYHIDFADKITAFSFLRGFYKFIKFGDEGGDTETEQRGIRFASLYKGAFGEPKKLPLIICREHDYERIFSSDERSEGFAPCRRIEDVIIAGGDDSSRRAYRRNATRNLAKTSRTLITTAHSSSHKFFDLECAAVGCLYNFDPELFLFSIPSRSCVYLAPSYFKNVIRVSIDRRHRLPKFENDIIYMRPGDDIYATTKYFYNKLKENQNYGVSSSSSSTSRYN